MLPITRLTVIARRRDSELERIYGALAHPLEADNRSELAELLGRGLASRPDHARTATLDLVGHSMSGSSLLRLGDWVIDAAQASVIAFFRELAEHEALPRLGVCAVRLLGCATAGSAHARFTIRALADVLGVEVFGTTEMIGAAHYDSTGFSDRYAHALVSSEALRREPFSLRVPSPGASKPHIRTLDLDGLPAFALDELPPTDAPRYVVDARTAADLLRGIRRTEGAELAGLLALPSCEIALPVGQRYVRLELLLDEQFVRVFPGDLAAGVVYPVDDVAGVRQLLERIR